ncbi:hypothetical protein GF354_05345 [Candidatus Peregrinibacteria bacterium]|nr:hypothetical protein [Candidatus Peregrinibacteria bacterium]
MPDHKTLDFGSGDLTRALDEELEDMQDDGEEEEEGKKYDTQRFDEEYVRVRLEGAPEKEPSGLFLDPEDIDTIMGKTHKQLGDIAGTGILQNRSPLVILGSKRFRELKEIEQYFTSIISGEFFRNIHLGTNTDKIEKYFAGLISEVEQKIDITLQYRAEILSKNSQEDKIDDLKSILERKKESLINKIIEWCSEFITRARFLELERNPSSLDPIELTDLREEISQLVPDNDLSFLDPQQNSTSIFTQDHLELIDSYFERSVEAYNAKIKALSQTMLDADLNEVKKLRSKLSAFVDKGIEGFNSSKLKFIDVLIGMLENKQSIIDLMTMAITGNISVSEYGREKLRHNLGTYIQVVIRSPKTKQDLGIHPHMTAKQLQMELYKHYGL